MAKWLKAVKDGVCAPFRGMTWERWFQTLGGVWTVCAALLLILRPEDTYYTSAFGQDLPWWLLLGCAVLGVELVLLADRLFSVRVEGYLLLIGSVGLALVLAARANSATKFYLYCGLAAVMAVIVAYAASRGLLRLPAFKLPRWLTAAVLAVLFCAVGGAIAAGGVARYRGYYSPNFDFGIFCQMFHNMKESFQPLNTCERNELISHFAVHISPIYYLLLPAYALFPDPATLQIGQGLVLASAVVPLWLLAREKGLSEKVALALAAVYAFYPAVVCGCSYDLHENCFLAPLLLWMFWFYESGRRWPLLVAVVLVLAVKEDAAEYVMLFAAYIMVSRREYRLGALLLGVALVWFGAALWLLNTYGTGDMSSRYAVFAYGGGGLLSMVKTLIVNPGLFVREVFNPNEDSKLVKLRYLLETVVPLGVMLFTGRHFSRYLLAVPLLVNLLSNWPYQTNIRFQYSFGMTAFFLYLCVLNVADMKPRAARGAVTYAVVSSLILCLLVTLPDVREDVSRYRRSADRYARLDAVMAQIPDDASVTASTFLMPHLAARAVLYEDYYHPTVDTDFLVLDLRPGLNANAQTLEQTYTAAGYIEVAREDKLVLVMQSPTYAGSLG